MTKDWTNEIIEISEKILLSQAIGISERLNIPIHTVEQIRNSLKNNENREAGYFGLYPKQFQEVKEALK